VCETIAATRTELEARKPALVTELARLEKEENASASPAGLTNPFAPSRRLP
jgi:hypothetical protein